MPSFALLALSIFFTAMPAFAELETRFVEAGEAAATCSHSKPLAECYGPAAQALAAYQASRPNREKQYGDEIRSFAGPRVFLTGQPTERAYVLIHSYTMSPAEMDHIADEIRARGSNVVSLLLEGHGSRSVLSGGPVALKDVKREHWKTDVHFGVNIAHALGKKIILIGYSLGGMLTLHEGSAAEPEIDALLAIAPHVALNDKMWAGIGACSLKPLLTSGLDQFIGKHASDNIYRKAYAAEYLDGTCELLNLARDFNRFSRSASVINNAFRFEETMNGQKNFTKIQREEFAKVKVPFVMISSPDDQVVDHLTNARLTQLSTSKGVLLQSTARDHLDYGLAHPQQRDYPLFTLALDILERVTKD